MKSIHIKYFAALTILTLVGTSCADPDFDNRRFQSVDSHGESQSIISTGVTATGGSEFIAYSVLPSADAAEITLIPVVLNAKDVASEDIHVQMVPATDTLASYNDANGTDFAMPGDPGSPAFTLVDNGVVTIPKGSSVGYLKVRTTANDYFGDQLYAFSYKIGSVQEPGYIISGNHNFGIAAVIGKNQYEGTYHAVGIRYNFGAAADYTGWDDAADAPNGTVAATIPWDFDTPTASRGLTTLAVHVGQPNGGLGTMNITVNPDNTVTIVSTGNTGVAALVPLPGKVSTYDPATKTFRLYYQWTNASGTFRVVEDVMTFEN
jgi:hypothetical protein